MLDSRAKEAADAYCRTNNGWKYTGKWKNVKEGNEEISFFEVE